MSLAMPRVYTPFNGFMLDGDFATHTGHCERCRSVDPAQPATLANLCLDGAILWKREHVAQAAPKLPKLADDHTVSREEARRAMRYKE